MTATKNSALLRQIRKHLADGFEKKESLPNPGTRFHKLGTIFSRTTGLIKSGVIPPNEIPMWYSVYKAFPPKYEPQFNRPALDVKVKEIYYAEDKLRAAIKRWDMLDLKSTIPNASQKLVTTFRERRTSTANDNALIEEILESQKERGVQRGSNLDNMVSEAIQQPLP